MEKFQGFSSKSFYKGGKRKIDLERAAEKVAKRRSGDALASRRGGGVLTSHSKVHKIFPKQADALEFAEKFDSVKVFAFEVDGHGKRNFVVCHPETLWSFYRHMDKRHYYEVIAEGKPCKLYFDIEFSKSLNEDYDGDGNLELFLKALRGDIKERFRIDPEILAMNSSSDLKFSWHLILDNVRFVDNIHAGNYVRCFCLDAGAAVEPVVLKEDGVAGLFVDQLVYTKNRNFRLYLSSKYNKTTILNLKMEAKPCKSTFMKSLITHVDGALELLRFEEGPKVSPKGPSCPQATGGSCTSSPFPEIDNYISSIIQDGDRRGTIRKWVLNDSRLTYEIQGSFKYCHNVERHHKSNNIKYIVDLGSGHFQQSCHDLECKNFRSNLFPLPRETMPWLFMTDDWDG